MKKRQKRGRLERWTRKQKGGPETRNILCNLSPAIGHSSQIYFTIPTSILGFMWLFFILILEKVYNLTFVILEKVYNLTFIIIEKCLFTAEIFKTQAVTKR